MDVSLLRIDVVTLSITAKKDGLGCLTLTPPVIRSSFTKPNTAKSPVLAPGKSRPTPHGDDYAYVVDKYWLVKECREDGTVVLVTRRGKEHLVKADSPNLRHANWWERFVHKNRFPELDPATGNVVDEEPAEFNSSWHAAS